MINNIILRKNKKIKKFNFFICRFATISYDTLILHNLNNKKININEIENIKLNTKEKKAINYKIVKILFIFYITVFTILSEKINPQQFIFCGIFFFLLSILCRKKIIELNIIKSDGKNICMELKIIEERKAKLFIKKIFEYKKIMIEKDFCNHG